MLQKNSKHSFGILTGDIKYNPEAEVLIMTTEILRNNLFKYKQESNKNQLDFEMDFDTELACIVYDNNITTIMIEEAYGKKPIMMTLLQHNYWIICYYK